MAEEPAVRGVHVFFNETLIAHLETRELTPSEFYEIDGQNYEVVSYLSVIENDLKPAFDVQVKPAH
jgi:hypothetical protein